MLIYNEKMIIPIKDVIKKNEPVKRYLTALGIDIKQKHNIKSFNFCLVKQDLIVSHILISIVKIEANSLGNNLIMYLFVSIFFKKNLKTIEKNKKSIEIKIQ